MNQLANNTQGKNTAKVKMLQKSFSSEPNPTQSDLAILDKEVNAFIDTMELQLDSAIKGGKNKVLQSKNIVSAGNRFAVVLTYLEILESKIATL
jgi:hypothetical protein